MKPSVRLSEKMRAKAYYIFYSMVIAKTFFYIYSPVQICDVSKNSSPIFIAYFVNVVGAWCLTLASLLLWTDWYFDYLLERNVEPISHPLWFFCCPPATRLQGSPRFPSFYSIYSYRIRIWLFRNRSSWLDLESH